MDEFKNLGAVENWNNDSWRVWVVKWVRKMSDQNLTDALKACKRASREGSVDASTREEDERTMIDLLKTFPVDTLRNIDDYLGENSEARVQWFTTPVHLDYDTVDGPTGGSGSGTLTDPDPTAPPIMCLAKLVRSPVEVTTKNNHVYEGVYAAFDNSTGENLLQAAYQKSAPNSPDSTNKPTVYDVLSIPSHDVLSMRRISAADLMVTETRELAYEEAKRGGGSQAATSLSPLEMDDSPRKRAEAMEGISPPKAAVFATDSAITNASSGGGRFRKLEPAPAWLCAPSGETPAKLTWALEGETGTVQGKSWDARDMFKHNEEKYGVVSSYIEDLTGYTTKVDRSNADFRKQENEAKNIERQIRQGRRGGGGRDEQRPSSGQYGSSANQGRSTAYKGPTQRHNYPARQFKNSGVRNRNEESTRQAPAVPVARHGQKVYTSQSSVPRGQNVHGKSPGSEAEATSDEKNESVAEEHSSSSSSSPPPPCNSALKMATISSTTSSKSSKPIKSGPKSKKLTLSTQLPKGLTPSETFKALVSAAVGGDPSESEEEVWETKTQTKSKSPSGFSLNVKAKEFKPVPAAAAANDFNPMIKASRFNINAQEFKPANSNSARTPPPPPTMSPPVPQFCGPNPSSASSPQAPMMTQQMYSVGPPMQMVNHTQPYAQASSSSYSNNNSVGGGGWISGHGMIGATSRFDIPRQCQPSPQMNVNVATAACGPPPILSSVAGILAPPQFVASQNGPFSVIRVVTPQGPVMPLIFQSGGVPGHPQMRQPLRYE